MTLIYLRFVCMWNAHLPLGLCSTRFVLIPKSDTRLSREQEREGCLLVTWCSELQPCWKEGNGKEKLEGNSSAKIGQHIVT